MRDRLFLELLVWLALVALPGETVVFLGDSITAGYGLDENDAYPALIQATLSPTAWKVVNAGVSGDTTAGGVRRVAWLLKSKPEIVVIALGANDGLRGVPTAKIQANLLQMITAIKASGARPLLVGMQMPPNYGADYRTQFAAVWPTVAAASQVPLLPFLLEGVAADRALNQTDGIHPTAAGQRIIGQHLLNFLGPFMHLDPIPRLAPPAGNP